MAAPPFWASMLRTSESLDSSFPFLFSSSSPAWDWHYPNVYFSTFPSVHSLFQPESLRQWHCRYSLLNSIFHTPIRSSKKFQGLIIDSPLWQIVFSKESITKAPVSCVLTMWSWHSSHQEVEPVASSWTWRGLRPSRNDVMWPPRLGQEKCYSFCLVLLGNLLSDPRLPYSKGRCTVRKPKPHGDAMYRCS